MKILGSLSLLLVAAGCSPLRTSQHDERYQWELTIHEVQTNLDDMRHDTSCFQTEIQILDGRLKSLETALASLKHQGVEKQQTRIDQMSHQFQALEKKWTSFEKKQESEKGDLESLSLHANETNMALSQFKGRIGELEREIITQNRRLETLSKLKENIESLAKSLKLEGQKIHRVRPGDTLDKIAKLYDIDVSKLKAANKLQKDLIVVDQELKIP